MRRLILLRHASACEGAPDALRELDAAGVEGARRAGVRMAELGAAWAPTLALCSTARRAEATLAGARAALPTLAHSQLVPGLYLAGAGGLLGELRRAPDEHACVLVVAHEPGLSTLARALAVRAERAALARFARGMAPASFAALALDVARWEDARPGCGELAAFEPP